MGASALKNCVKHVKQCIFVLKTNITRRLANKQRKLHNADIEGGLGGDRPGRSRGGSF